MVRASGQTVKFPCKICGKSIRSDFCGICTDCADECGVSELYEMNPDEYRANVERLISMGIWTRRELDEWNTRYPTMSIERTEENLTLLEGIKQSVKSITWCYCLDCDKLYKRPAIQLIPKDKKNSTNLDRSVLRVGDYETVIKCPVGKKHELRFAKVSVGGFPTQSWIKKMKKLARRKK